MITLSSSKNKYRNGHECNHDISKLDEKDINEFAITFGLLNEHEIHCENDDSDDGNDTCVHDDSSLLLEDNNIHSAIGIDDTTIPMGSSRENLQYIHISIQSADFNNLDSIKGSTDLKYFADIFFLSKWYDLALGRMTSRDNHDTNSIDNIETILIEIDDDTTMPIGSSKEDIENINIFIQKALSILDDYDPDDISIDNIETILQRARLANIPAKYLGEIYRDCLFQSTIHTKNSVSLVLSSLIRSM